MIKIISKKEGFRRCGVVHTRRPMLYSDVYFSAQKLKRLKADKMLIVQTVAEQAVDKGYAEKLKKVKNTEVKNNGSINRR